MFVKYDFAEIVKKAYIKHQFKNICTLKNQSKCNWLKTVIASGITVAIAAHTASMGPGGEESKLRP